MDSVSELIMGHIFQPASEETALVDDSFNDSKSPSVSGAEEASRVYPRALAF